MGPGYPLFKIYAKNKEIIWALFLFLILNSALYFFITAFQGKVPFNKFNYFFNAHHYLQDKRVTGGGFSLPNALGQYDAQWYLRIADNGYPENPASFSIPERKFEAQTYAFFPLYPLLVAGAKLFTHDVEVAAFFVTLIFLFLDFFSLYWVISRFYPKKIVLRSVLLLFSFPFSIFFRSYFSEGVYLFLFIWFSYFLIKRRFILASISISLLNITKANGWLLNLVLFYYLLMAFKKKNISLKQLFVNLSIVVLPFLLWILYMYIATGNPLIFYAARKAWVPFGFPITFFYNFSQIFIYPTLLFHSFYSSQIEVLGFLVVLLLFIKSKRSIKKEFWITSFVLWIFPFFSNIFMSFSRYQIVLFPLFIYLAKRFSNRQFYFVFSVFLLLLFTCSLFFINWWWIG